MTLIIDHGTSSPNYDDRPGGIAPSALVLHTTEGAWPSDLAWLCNPQKSGRYQRVSCHYVVSPTGRVFQIVADDKRAWHAGVGSYLGIATWNDISLGIEISHKRGDSYPPEQRAATDDLCRMLIRTYQIPPSMVVAHRWIAPHRKVDPTDWPDDALEAWVKNLYEPNWPAEWGRDAWERVKDWGIPTKWRAEHEAGRPLGKALTGEMTLIDGRVCQVFERGFITWLKDGETVVYRPVKP